MNRSKPLMPLYCPTSCYRWLPAQSYIGEQYRFTDIEREVFPALFRYVNSFWWHHISAVEAVKDDDEKLEKLFGWLEKQMTRDDIRLL